MIAHVLSGTDTMKIFATFRSHNNQYHFNISLRIQFLEDVKEFYDTHYNVNNWLNAKERMMTVLGPISSDPRMVQSQVQQVTMT